MDIRPIHTEADYKATLKEISTLMESDPELGTPEGDRLDILVTLVQAYEAKHVVIEAPDPVEAIKFRMEKSGQSAWRKAAYRLRTSSPSSAKATGSMRY